MRNQCTWCVPVLDRHYQTHYSENYNNIQGRLKAEKIREVLAGLKKQWSIFSRSKEVSDAAVKASYPIANEKASASKSYSDCQFVKTCMLFVGFYAMVFLVPPSSGQAGLRVAPGLR